ncbi:L-seryl-tRNA(Sec) selenium transferase [Methylopila jiangsuensis]|uniref:L-seryl-tRNA(Sec) selenium transferase n=1 Tax=Methylopila jiangsuensis TaxID=586230 RepID=A0A9W6JFU7_9HYPH|nr:L-seryl-tRNA(Sec) selenium transferase [Methylopila jiangsuensis]MDR6285893.1 L-seryl-tRNA(Ser) seleniumtransferase [Methylopila jiangsuensis]GLK75651.1 L-seryl-tRNA(Sec) selenium transferase [Methylopila jiangsuensis]
MNDQPSSRPPLPAVDRVLAADAARVAEERFGRTATVASVRARLEEARAAWRAGAAADISADRLAQVALAALEASETPSQRRVLNLTGTVLHTNLGRALLAEEAIAAVTMAMRSPTALEFDVATGRRGERDDHVRGLLRELTGAEDAVAVNNNAAAVLLTLNALAEGREAVVSRGELIEIGGAFRMPAIMARAGCVLREVGTTNRTHLADYEDAIVPATGLLMKVHPSNYRIEGFTKEVTARELAPLARARGLPLMDDLGSGVLVDLAAYGLQPERTVRQAVADGADVVTFSGDKLLGGPQAGLAVGRADLIRRLAKNPLKRALRLDKLRLAALEATLKLYRDPDRLAERLPTLMLLTRPAARLKEQAARLKPAFEAAVGPDVAVEVAELHSQIGSGALPLASIPSAGLTLAPLGARRSGSALLELAAAFRALAAPVIGRIADERLIFDLRGMDDAAALEAGLAELARARAEAAA